MIEAFHQAELVGITGGLKHDWNRRPGAFDGQRTGCRGRRDNGHLAVDEIRREARQPVKVTVGPAIFDGNVLTVDVTRLLQSCAESGRKVSAGSALPTLRKPTTGLAGCCAPAERGQNAVAPKTPMNSRRRMGRPPARKRSQLSMMIIMECVT